MKQHGNINPKQESSNYVHNLPPRPTTFNQNRQNFNPPSIGDVPQPSLYYNGKLYNNAETSSKMAKKIGKNTMKIESKTIQSSKNNHIQSGQNPFNHFANPIQSKRETSSNKINSQNQTIKRANEQLQKRQFNQNNLREIKQKEQSGKNKYVNRQESETARKKRQLNEEIKRRISQGMNQIRDEKIRVQGMSHIQDERIRPQETNPIAQGGVNTITQRTNPILQGTNPIAQGVNPITQGTNPILQGANCRIQETNSINTNRVTEGLMDQREKLTLNVPLNNPEIHSNFPPLQIVPRVSVPRNQMGINMGAGNYNPYNCNYNNVNYNRRKTQFDVKKHKLNFVDEGYDKIITQQYTYENFIDQCCYQLQMIYQQLLKQSQSTYNRLHHRLQWMKLQQLEKIVLKEQIQFNITEILNKLNAKQQNLTRQIDLLSTQMDSNNECQHRLTRELFSIQSNGQIINHHHKSNQQNGQHNQIKQLYRTISILHSQAEQLQYSLLSIQRLVN